GLPGRPGRGPRRATLPSPRASSLPSLPSSSSWRFRAGAFRTSSLAWPLVLLVGGFGFFRVDPQQCTRDAEDLDFAAGIAEGLDIGGDALVAHRCADGGLARRGAWGM